MTDLKISVGTDITEVGRIERSLKNPRFFEKVFGKTEKEYLLSKKGEAFCRSAAARFAAKEAFGKAVGTGVSGFGLQEVEVVNDDSGCPHIVLSGRAAQKFKDREFSVSISHTGNYATATVLAVTEDGNEQKDRLS